MKQEKIKRKTYYLLPSEIQKVKVIAKKQKTSESIYVRSLINKDKKSG